MPDVVTRHQLMHHVIHCFRRFWMRTACSDGPTGSWYQKDRINASAVQGWER